MRLLSYQSYLNSKKGGLLLESKLVSILAKEPDSAQK